MSGKKINAPVRFAGSLSCVRFYDTDMLFTEATEGKTFSESSSPCMNQQTHEGWVPRIYVSFLWWSFSCFERGKSLKSADWSVECDLCWVWEAQAPRKAVSPLGMRKVRAREHRVAGQPCPAGKVFDS